MTPAVGGNFSIATPGKTFSTADALETILQMLQSAKAYGATIVGTAGAGNKAIAEIRNPAASGRNAYIYALDFFTAVAMQINLFLDGTTITPAGVPLNLQVGGAAGVCLVGGSNQLAPTGSLLYTSPSIAANTTFQLPQPWILEIPAGHNIQLQGQTVNQAFTANVRFYELNT